MPAPKWIHQSRLARVLRVEAIVLYPFIFTVRRRGDVSERLARHELMHVEQVRRLGWWRFYVSYLAWYLRGLARFRDHRKAYRENPYEVEARRAEPGPY